MSTSYEEQTFEHVDYSSQEMYGIEYYKCTFVNCNFSHTALRSTDFIDCIFSGCNFSLATLDDAGLKNVHFTSCKLIGINFSVCKPLLFSVGFKDCHLDYSTFFKKNMKKTKFDGCSLKEVDFEEADLSMAIFNKCDMTNTHFIHTNLEKADFRTATNYTMDAEINKLKKAKFSYLGIAGLLAKYNIDIEFE